MKHERSTWCGHGYRAVIALGLVGWLGGCGIQLGSAVRHTAARTRGTLELGGRIHKARESGPYGSWSLTTAFPSDRPASLRNVTLGTGWRLVAADCLRFEVGPEAALGEPATIAYDRLGLYVGGAAAMLIRLPVFGRQHDNIVGVAPIGYSLDAVLSGTGGRWTRALLDGGKSEWEAGLQIGLRFTGFSDLLVANDERWEGPWDEH